MTPDYQSLEQSIVTDVVAPPPEAGTSPVLSHRLSDRLGRGRSQKRRGRVEGVGKIVEIDVMGHGRPIKAHGAGN